MQTAAPVPLMYVSWPHGKQEAMLGEPGALAAVPTGHALQAAWPVSGW